MTIPDSSRQRFRLFRSGGGTTSTPIVDVQVAAGTSGDLPRRLDPHQRRRYLREYVQWLWPQRFALGGVLAMAVISIAIDLCWPLISKHIIDDIVLVDHLASADRLHQLAVFGGCMGALFLLNAVIGMRRNLLLARINALLAFALRRRLFAHILRLPLGELAGMKTGGIISRLSSDVDSTMGLVQLAFIGPLLAALRLGLTLAILFTLNWMIAAAAIVVMPPIMLLHHYGIRRIRPLWKSLGQDRSEIDGRVAESMGGIRVVRGFGREFREGLEYGIGHHTVIRKTLFAIRIQQLVGLVWDLLMPAAQLTIILLGGLLVIHGHATIGTLMAFQAYLWRLVDPIMSIIHSISETQRGLAAMERVFDVLARPQDKPDAADAVAAPTAVGELRFEQVSFSYDPARPVLQDIDLTVPGGSVVALVGPSGAGKSTLTDLVGRFHDPTTGRITLNGTDLRRLALRSYRQLLGIVQQDVFLFDGTVSENLAYGRRDASAAQIADAARRAHADEFIQRLPQGYETRIGERGVKLSGGQRQRLSIARAILADPAILILDEATSNLDTESEQLIQAAMQELLAARTTFIVAHRLSTIAHADLIVVLDQGRIRERGTHAQLLAANGMYAAMVERQRAAGVPRGEPAWDLITGSAG